MRTSTVRLRRFWPFRVSSWEKVAVDVSRTSTSRPAAWSKSCSSLLGGRFHRGDLGHSKRCRGHKPQGTRDVKLGEAPVADMRTVSDGYSGDREEQPPSLAAPLQSVAEGGLFNRVRAPAEMQAFDLAQRTARRSERNPFDVRSHSAGQRDILRCGRIDVVASHGPIAGSLPSARQAKVANRC